MATNNKELDLRHAKIVTERILSNGIDITSNYDDWLKIAFSLASLGQEGLPLFLTVSSLNPRYNQEECADKFNRIMGDKRGCISIATFFSIASLHGIDISMPKGRPKKTAEQRKEETSNNMVEGFNYLASKYEFRFNVWTNRPEMRVIGEDWHPVSDRDLSSIYCSLKTQGINVSEKDVRAMLNFNEFVKDYDAVREWLDSLPEWQPSEGDDLEKGIFADDPIRTFFEHILFTDDWNHEFYIYFLRKWFVGLVGMMMGKIEEHNLMLVLVGKQHKGKTYFIRNILPPELQLFRYDANPSSRIDKDFVISLTEFVLIFLDEFSFTNNAKSDTYKYITTSTVSNERDAYAHYRERRSRRAALVGATNNKYYIKERDGDRRYLSVDVAGTIDLHKFPLDYMRAYAMAKYLLEHGYKTKPTAQESEWITQHNEDFIEPSDCEEVIRTFYRPPLELERCKALTAGDIYSQLRARGLCGNNFSTVEIGRTLNRLGYNRHPVHGTNKYMIIEKSQDELNDENERDAAEIRRAIIEARGEEPEYEETLGL